MRLAIGDRVVHPRHGLGNVVKLDERQFEPGVTREYYEIAVPGSTVWVPLDLQKSGLRKLTGKGEIARCRQVLQSPAVPLNENPRLWHTELSAHLKLGTISAQCEVVRDLVASDKHRRLNGSIANFMQVTQDVLCQEWATVEAISLGEATAEVRALLEKGHLRVHGPTTTSSKSR
jgi:RNA polymerase-interacting CarD/CdnL/TRCF family regulator